MAALICIENVVGGLPPIKLKTWQIEI